jgi:hypothetical protein
MKFTSGKKFAFVLGLAAVTSCCAAQESKYLGVWNYAQPNGRTSENIAQLQCPAPKGSPEGMHGFGMMIPQIGNLTITNAADGHLKGVTDQGCSWTFKVGSSSAELEPASQTCFNKVIGSSYTITQWSIRVDGNQESETLRAKSHHQMGDCDFVMQNGKRAKAEDIDSSSLFVGDWRYDTLDPGTRINVAQKICGEESAKPTFVPISGTVTISKVSDGVLQAVTSDGCSWRLKVQGNTAILDSPQSCEKDGKASKLNSWTIASDGQHQLSNMNSERQTGDESCTTSLGTGSLTRASSN